MAVYRALVTFLVVGKHHIPADGPVIFAGNHPNALIDGFVVMTQCGRSPVHFMANAKLWRYPVMRRFLDALRAVPVRPREEHSPDVDNQPAFDRLFQLIEAGECMGIFPEGISHTESQLVRLKTGAARIALGVSARRRARVTIIPCGLTYMHRHRFRSQALLQFGEPIVMGDDWLGRYRDDEGEAVKQLTEHLRLELIKVTLNAPDWETLRFVHAARRLYKPTDVRLSPGTYVELSRRFVDTYLSVADHPTMVRLRTDIEDYQSQLELLGLKDYQLSRPISVTSAWKRVILRTMITLLLLPFAIPGALIHLPVGWIAAAAGERLSEDQDDVATLKVISVLLLLPLIYLTLGTMVGTRFGFWWGALTAASLPFSFYASIRILEAQSNLLLSSGALLRLIHFDSELRTLRETRERLVAGIRRAADEFADTSRPRVFDAPDFEH